MKRDPWVPLNNGALLLTLLNSAFIEHLLCIWPCSIQWRTKVNQVHQSNVHYILCAYIIHWIASWWRGCRKAVFQSGIRRAEKQAVVSGNGSMWHGGPRRRCCPFSRLWAQRVQNTPPLLSVSASLISYLCGLDGATSSSFIPHKRSISLDSKCAFF